jgi:hypothetical protein
VSTRTKMSLSTTAFMLDCSMVWYACASKDIPLLVVAIAQAVMWLIVAIG